MVAAWGRFFRIIRHYFDSRIHIKLLFWRAENSFLVNLLALARIWWAQNRDFPKGSGPGWHCWYYQVDGSVQIRTFRRLQAVKSIVDNKCWKNGQLIPLF